MKSVTSVKQEDIKEQWFIVDVAGQRIGRIASIVAELLQSKNSVLTRRNLKPMNKVIIVNAAKIDFTEKKGMTKFYKNYSGYPGGLRFVSLEELSKTFPEKPLEFAIKGMLPRTKRGREMMANLKIFANTEHPHQAQNPVDIKLKEVKF